MIRSLAIALLLAAGPACGNDKAGSGTGPQTPPPPGADAAAPGMPEGVRGVIYDDGKPRDLGAMKLDIHATSCREPDLAGVDIHVDAVRDTDPQLSIGGKAGLEVGVTYHPRTAADPGADSPVQIAAYASDDPNRGSEFTLPVTAWVRFDKLAPGGPVEVSFEADFGKRGKAQGHIVVPTTEPTTCRIPAPPSPP
ncbi:MAG TPA: hypothetical protein VL172_02825 [Kofleriaceae bacterium]|jgi:hypothetical protein|nr:hypothetical protein [Kofleriaceae bacterium]